MPRLPKQTNLNFRTTAVCLAAAGLAFTLSACGCSTTGKPRFFAPESQDRQQQRAEQFDPFPENSIAPEDPAIRPPGFERNTADVQRFQPNERRAYRPHH